MKQDFHIRRELLWKFEVTLSLIHSLYTVKTSNEMTAVDENPSTLVSAEIKVINTEGWEAQKI